MTVPLGDGPLGAIDERAFKHNHKIGLHGFQSKIVEITTAELLALNATPKTLVPAPGRGRMLLYDGMILQYRPGTVEYVSQAGAGAVTNHLVTVVNLTNVALTIAAQPLFPSYVTFTIVDTTPSITAGLVTIIGKDRFGQTITEVANVVKTGLTFRSQKVFEYIASITTSTFTVLGGGGDETIIVGVEPATAEDLSVYYGTLASGRRVATLPSQGFLRTADAFDDDKVVVSADLTNTSLTLTATAAALPALSQLVVTITDTTPTLVAGGVINITGTGADGAAQAETIVFVAGTLVYVSALAYLTVTSIRTVGFTVLGGSSDELIKVGTAAPAASAWVPPPPLAVVPPENVALVLAMDTGEVASGNGSLVARVFYRTVELALRG